MAHNNDNPHFESGVIVDLPKERRIRGLMDELRNHLAQHPEIADRTVDLLNGDLPMGKKRDGQLVIRVTDDLLQKLDEMVPIVERMPEVANLGRVSRSSVVRMALMEGLRVMEARAA